MVIKAVPRMDWFRTPKQVPVSPKRRGVQVAFHEMGEQFCIPGNFHLLGNHFVLDERIQILVELSSTIIPGY